MLHLAFGTLPYCGGDGSFFLALARAVVLLAMGRALFATFFDRLVTVRDTTDERCALAAVALVVDCWRCSRAS